MILTEEVNWTYPHAEAASLTDVDLQIPAGQFVVLCGASGSGKSTALRLLNGLIPRFHDEGELSGRVTVDGLDTAEVELDELGRITGTVLQHPRRQFFTDSAAEEIAFGMENFGLPAAQIRARVEEIMATLAAAVPVEQKLRELSGGQQQQVAVAAAMAHVPGVLLLDEPSSNLSADAVARLHETLRVLKAQGVTIIVAEHRLRYLEDLADRIIVMSAGSIDVEWSADEFSAVTDEDLAREGLRGTVSSVELPSVPALGASVVPDGAFETSRGWPDHLSSPSVAGLPLVLEGIRCRLGGRTVLELDRVSFPAGRVSAIRGVNGAGKSTLARIITGLQASDGTVSLGDRSMSRKRRQRLSAIVMQDVQRQLFTDSVKAEIELAGTDTSTSPDPRDVLSALDLTDLAQRHPLALSGGQQQRLVIAAARVADRRIFVFDEPSSGVDRRHLTSIAEEIRAVAAEGAVVLLISHDEDLLALTADAELTLRALD